MQCSRTTSFLRSLDCQSRGRIFEWQICLVKLGRGRVEGQKEAAPVLAGPYAWSPGMALDAIGSYGSHCTT